VHEDSSLEKIYQKKNQTKVKNSQNS